MAQWQYHFEEVTLVKETKGEEENQEYIERVFDDAGGAGWEAVAILSLPGPGSRFLAVFKKPR